VDPHDHVLFLMSSGQRVVFNDPRRFGLMALATPAEEYPSLAAMGPEPLSASFTAAALARACRGKRTSLKVTLLDQRVVAGLGNIYASEALPGSRPCSRQPFAVASRRIDRRGSASTSGRASAACARDAAAQSAA
jgi:formamidopyrimidine-DNA glycosylase